MPGRLDADKRVMAGIERGNSRCGTSVRNTRRSVPGSGFVPRIHARAGPRTRSSTTSGELLDAVAAVDRATEGRGEELSGPEGWRGCPCRALPGWRGGSRVVPPAKEASRKQRSGECG